MRKRHFALRLQSSLMEELSKAAQAEGKTINQYINIAVAEKLASRRTAAQFFAARSARADISKALGLLARLETKAEPAPGDQLPGKAEKNVY